MEQIRWNDNWKLWDLNDSFALVWDLPEYARNITLPHDSMIERDAYAESPNGNNTGYRDGGSYTYYKELYVSEQEKGNSLLLKIEGSYMNTFVYVNQQLAGKCNYGYTTFYVDMTNFLCYGEKNEIRVLVRNSAVGNSRWYSGGGIYRDVYLVKGSSVQIVPDGVFVRTEEADHNLAVLSIETQIHNRNPYPVSMFLETKLNNPQGECSVIDRVPLTLMSGEVRSLTRRIAVKNPDLWSEYTPSLYSCKTALLDEKDKVLDKNQEIFGIRKLQLDTVYGLRVNGKPVKLRGACIHHDSGLLGSATYEDVQYRQVRRLKAAGFNAIRMSHQPMSQAMLRSCDALGVYVMDEAFDMWTRGKSDNDYGLFFQECWKKDLEAMIRKDRNHPCVIMYSLGNEIPEIGSVQGAKQCADMVEYARKLDDSRYTLAAINGVFASGDAIETIVKDVVSDLTKEGIPMGNVNHFLQLMDSHLDYIVSHPEVSKRLDTACTCTDIVGYNYMTARYERDGIAYPNRIIVGSETYPPEIGRNWGIIQKSSHVIGDFTWTGWDYIGEAGVGVPAYEPGKGGFGATYPCQLAYVGDFDITGNRKPASYYREIIFGFRKSPFIAVQNPAYYGRKPMPSPWTISDCVESFSFPGYEDKPVSIEVYSAGDEVELWLNGKSFGRKEAGVSVNYITYFDGIYEPGSLTAISYLAGIEIGRETLKTPGKDRKIMIEDEKGRKDGIIFLNISICDEEGNVATDDFSKIEIKIGKNLKLLGFGNGNPTNEYSYQGSVTETFYGRALAIVKSEAIGDGKVILASSQYGKIEYRV